MPVYSPGVCSEARLSWSWYSLSSTAAAPLHLAFSFATRNIPFAESFLAFAGSNAYHGCSENSQSWEGTWPGSFPSMVSTGFFLPVLTGAGCGHRGGLESFGLVLEPVTIQGAPGDGAQLEPRAFPEHASVPTPASPFMEHEHQALAMLVNPHQLAAMSISQMREQAQTMGDWPMFTQAELRYKFRQSYFLCHLYILNPEGIPTKGVEIAGIAWLRSEEPGF